MTTENQLTRSEAITQLAGALTEPISLAEFTKQVLDIWHSEAKNPEAKVRQAIRNEHIGEELLFLDQEENTLISTQTAVAGARYRFLLSPEELRFGDLHVQPSFRGFFSLRRPAEELQLIDEEDHTIPGEIVTREQRTTSVLGSYTYEIAALDIGWWYKKRKIKNGYALLVTVVDWANAVFRLQPESKRERKRRTSEIEAANQLMADALFHELETSRHESVEAEKAVPTAFARLKGEFEYPPDHWLIIVENDPRMRWFGDEIRYADVQTPLENLSGRDKEPEIIAVTGPEAKQVYRFKASFKHDKNLWRRIEIQGGQTLGYFDRILRHAFNHDTFDHLSGFWQYVRRGNTSRFREVDLGTVNPYEGGGATDMPVGSLELTPGDRLKYVYDFGDWIEHEILLEEITEPEAEVEYPRLVDQNEPDYEYCQVCREEGRETVAKYICQTCSEVDVVFLCDKCIYPDHEDHYLTEMVY